MKGARAAPRLNSSQSDKPTKTKQRFVVLWVFLSYCSEQRCSMTDTVMVFTSKSLSTMLSEGGTGNWAGNAERLKHTKWVVATRNGNSGWTQGDEAHGSAFLVGRISGVKSSPAPEQDRFVVMFDQYAEVSIPNAWTNNRNPIAYTSLTDLGIDPEKLQWKQFSAHQHVQEASGLTSKTAGTVIDQARTMIASALSISPESVKITVAF